MSKELCDVAQKYINIIEENNLIESTKDSDPKVHKNLQNLHKFLTNLYSKLDCEGIKEQYNKLESEFNAKLNHIKIHNKDELLLEFFKSKKNANDFFKTKLLPGNKEVFMKKYFDGIDNSEYQEELDDLFEVNEKKRTDIIKKYSDKIDAYLFDNTMKKKFSKIFTFNNIMLSSISFKDISNPSLIKNLIQKYIGFVILQNDADTLKEVKTLKYDSDSKRISTLFFINNNDALEFQKFYDFLRLQEKHRPTSDETLQSMSKAYIEEYEKLKKDISEQTPTINEYEDLIEELTKDPILKKAKLELIHGKQFSDIAQQQQDLVDEGKSELTKITRTFTEKNKEKEYNMHQLYLDYLNHISEEKTEIIISKLFEEEPELQSSTDPSESPTTLPSKPPPPPKARPPPSESPTTPLSESPSEPKTSLFESSPAQQIKQPPPPRPPPPPRSRTSLRKPSISAKDSLRSEGSLVRNGGRRKKPTTLKIQKKSQKETRIKKHFLHSSPRETTRIRRFL